MPRETIKELKEEIRMMFIDISGLNEMIETKDKQIQGYESTLQDEYQRNSALQSAINQVTENSYFERWKNQQPEIEWLKQEVERLERENREQYNDQGRPFEKRIRELEQAIANMAIKASK